MSHTGVVKTKEEKSVRPEKMIALDNILVATDFSAGAERALQYAVVLARRYESHIFLTHVITPDAYAMMAPETAAASRETACAVADKGVKDIVLSGRLRDVRHDVLVEEGALWPTIETLIGKHAIDLVVVGTHKMGAIEKVLVGSNAEQIFRQAGCPVLTVGPGVKDAPPREIEFRNILFATDFGDASDRAAAYALSLAQEHGAKLTLLHVITHAPDYSADGVAIEREKVRQLLQERVKPECGFWCKPEFRMTIGDPSAEILRIALETQADLIVLGAKTRTGLAGHVPYTKAHKVVSGAVCPVLTVR
jgi:nucleotide-binding universal stress UspA family protein